MPVDCSQRQASESFVWAARPRKRRRKRGKRAGVLVRLRCRAFRPPLPTILLANVQSLDNKLCELRARISYQRETRDCCVICLTETWMSAMVPDSAIEFTGFSVHRSDRTKELTGKSRGGASVSISTTRGVMKGTYRPVAIVDISTYRTIYGYERDHFWCSDILRLIIFL